MNAIEHAQKIGREHRAAYRDEFGQYPARGQVGDWDSSGIEAMLSELRQGFDDDIPEATYDACLEAYREELFAD